MSEAKFNEKLHITSRMNSQECIVIPDQFTLPLELKPFSTHPILNKHSTSEDAAILKQIQFNTQSYGGVRCSFENKQILKSLQNSGAKIDYSQINEQESRISFKARFFIINFIQKIGKNLYSIKRRSFSSLINQLLNESNQEEIKNKEDQQYKNTDYLLRVLWNIFIIVILFIQFITIPLQVSFDNLKLEYFNLSLLIIFGVDLFNSLKIGKQEQYHFQQVKQIIIDFTRIILLIIVLQLSSKLKFTFCVQIIYFVITTQKLYYTFQQVSEVYYLENIIGRYRHYLSIIIRIIVIAHIIGCLFHQLGQINLNNNSWLLINDLIQNDNYHRYLISLEWGFSNLITTNAKYEIVNQDEIWFTIFIKLIIILHFAEVIKDIYQNIKSINNNISIQNSTILQDIKYFFTYHNTSLTLRKRIFNYLEAHFIKQNRSKQIATNFIQILPENLQEELKQEQRLKEIIQCKLLKHFSQQTISKIIEKVELLTLEPNQQILDQKKQDDCSLYIIQTGSVKVYNQCGNSIRNYTKLSNHDSFGQWSFFTGQERKASVKTDEFSKIYKINPIAFRNVISTNMKDLETFYHIQHQIMYSKQLNYIDIRCYGCQSSNHMIINCPHLVYQPNLEKLIIKDNFDKQERSSFIRNFIDRNSHTFLNRPMFLESLKCFRTKNSIFPEMSESDADESDSQSMIEYSNKKYNMETSIQKQWNDKNEEDCIIESKKSVQQSYPSQILRDDDDQDFKTNQLTIPNQRKSSNQLTLNEQSSKTYLQQRSHQKSAQSNQTSNKQESYSSLVFNEEQIPQIKNTKNFKNMPQSNQIHEQKSERINTKYNKNYVSKSTKLNYIDEQKEENTLNLTNPDEKSFQSPSKQTNHYMYYSNNQKQMKLSSVLSSIAKQRSVMTQKISQLNHSVHNTLYQSILQNVNPMQIMDLSQYEKEDEFEVMFHYKVFFPYFNSNIVIQRFNKFQVFNQNQKIINSNYTLYYSVKKLLNKTILINEFRN